MPVWVLVIEADRISDVEVKGGRLLEIPFRADRAALAVERALSRLADEDYLRPTASLANGVALGKLRRSG